MADFLGGVHHFFGSRNLYDALGVAYDATGYLFSKHISSESVEGSVKLKVKWFDEKYIQWVSQETENSWAFT